MKNVVRLAIVDPNDSSRASLKRLMLGVDIVWLEAECSRYEFFADVISQTNPDIALVALDADPQKGLELVAEIHDQLPSCSVLCISSSQEGSLILQAMRNGAREFLSYPLKLDDFLAAIQRIQQKLSSRDAAGEVRSRQVITVAGVCGGVGCTSLAVNLACALAQHEGNNVAIIDLDLALGDADVWLDIIPDYTIQDVAENITRLDFSLLKRSLTRHDCGVYLLPRPVHLEGKPLITPDELRRVLALLKATFTHLVIDVSKSFSGLDMAAMTSSDSVLLVTQLDLPCLRNVVRIMQFFEEYDGLPDKTKVVVNRLGLEDTQISMNKALETIGREIFWQVPNDYASMVESRNNGVPLITQTPRARITKSVEQLADNLDHAEPEADAEETTRQRKGLFGFLTSGSK